MVDDIKLMGPGSLIDPPPMRIYKAPKIKKSTETTSNSLSMAMSDDTFK